MLRYKFSNKKNKFFMKKMHKIVKITPPNVQNSHLVFHFHASRRGLLRKKSIFCKNFAHITPTPHPAPKDTKSRNMNIRIDRGRRGRKRGKNKGAKTVATRVLVRRKIVKSYQIITKILQSQGVYLFF